MAAYAAFVACATRKMSLCCLCRPSGFRTSWFLRRESFHCMNRLYDEAVSSTEQIKAAMHQAKPKTKAQKISRAMIAYMERARSHDAMMKEQTAEFEIGKRHLANIMGEDPDCFSQEDIDSAIEYLLPSGLFHKRARPMLKPPVEIFPKRRAAQFGKDGRPFHFLFYTLMPNYYEILHDAAVKYDALNVEEDRLRVKGQLEGELSRKLSLFGSTWIDYSTLKTLTMEKISEHDHRRFIIMLERLYQHPLAHLEEAFITKYRKQLAQQEFTQFEKQLMIDETGRSYMTAKGKRKTAIAEVTVRGRGTGSVTVNGKPLLEYFPYPLEREQIMFPLQLTGMLLDVDVMATVENSGSSAQAGAIRYGLSLALSSFVSKEVQENMRLAGLLQRDYRRRERKKPGQPKARKKYTWKRR